MVHLVGQDGNGKLPIEHSRVDQFTAHIENSMLFYTGVDIVVGDETKALTEYVFLKRSLGTVFICMADTAKSEIQGYRPIRQASFTGKVNSG